MQSAHCSDVGDARPVPNMYGTGFTHVTPHLLL
jgi:hypothetical protein